MTERIREGAESHMAKGRVIPEPVNPIICRHKKVKDRTCVDCGRTVEIELPVATCTACGRLIRTDDPVRVTLSYGLLGDYFASRDHTAADIYHAGCES